MGSISCTQKKVLKKDEEDPTRGQYSEKGPAFDETLVLQCPRSLLLAEVSTGSYARQIITFHEDFWGPRFRLRVLWVEVQGVLCWVKEVGEWRLEVSGHGFWGLRDSEGLVRRPDRTRGVVADGK